jgi:hypothetical protein
MPTNKQIKLYENRLRQLAQLGFRPASVLELTNSQPSEALVEQCASPTECLALDLADQGTLFMLWLSVAGGRPGVRFHDFHFVPPWPDKEFQTLPTTESCRGEAYVLPNGWEFPREDVLNFCFGKTGWRLPLTPVEGWLCAYSATPIPPEYKHGAVIEVRIEFFGKSGCQLAQTISTIMVDRSIVFDELQAAARAKVALATTAATQDLGPCRGVESVELTSDLVAGLNDKWVIDKDNQTSNSLDETYAESKSKVNPDELEIPDLGTQDGGVNGPRRQR